MLLTYASGKNNKIHISIDGEYRFTVDADFWYSLGIYQSTQVEEEELARIEEEIMTRRAFNKGMDYLSRRAHSKKELIEKISRTSEKKYAIMAVDMLEQRGYVDDSAFAEQYYEYLQRVKHFGAKRIEMELNKKGIDRTIIAALREADESEPQEEIRALLEGRFASKLYDEKAKQRTVNALLRLGYRYSDIRNALYSCDIESQE
ncbi:MAG: RecX family transcriptional regulator [Clostridia bacterium]|nr:RecX family transcriptional regulator [Clostridia bacterium]